MTDDDLALALRALGRRLEHDAVTDLRPGVAVRLARATPARASKRRRPRVLAIAALAVLATAGAGLAAAGDTWREVRSWLGSAGVHTERVESIPPLGPAAIRELGLGGVVPAEVAERLVGMTVPSHTPLGAPDLILGAATPTPVVSFVWRPSGRLPAAPGAPSVGAILTVATGGDPSEPFLLAKRLPPGTTAEFLRLRGGPEAVWLDGVPHAVTTLDGRTRRFRLASNVLLWRLDGRLHRLELTLDRDAAVRVAEALLP